MAFIRYQGRNDYMTPFGNIDVEATRGIDLMGLASGLQARDQADILSMLMGAESSNELREDTATEMNIDESVDWVKDRHERSANVEFNPNQYNITARGSLQDDMARQAAFDERMRQAQVEQVRQEQMANGQDRGFAYRPEVRQQMGYTDYDNQAMPPSYSDQNERYWRPPMSDESFQQAPVSAVMQPQAPQNPQAEVVDARMRQATQNPMSQVIRSVGQRVSDIWDTMMDNRQGVVDNQRGWPERPEPQSMSYVPNSLEPLQVDREPVPPVQLANTEPYGPPYHPAVNSEMDRFAPVQQDTASVEFPNINGQSLIDAVVNGYFGRQALQDSLRQDARKYSTPYWYHHD